jgi:hypothetical protein
MPPLVSRLVALGLGLAVSLALAEGAVRLAGWAPRQSDTQSPIPRVFEPDPVLGWRAKPGSYVYPGYGDAVEPVVITILPDHSRSVGSGLADPEPSAEILLVGGSFTMGWALSDWESFPWRLQRRMRHLRVRNLGTSGYGTYQSLLSLERELPTRAPDLVLYGYMEHHERRNVASLSWLRFLAELARDDVAEVPYVTLGPDGELVRRPPLGHLHLPLRRELALVAFAEDVWMDLAIWGMTEETRAVTKKLLVEMARVSRAHGAEFGVVFLEARDKQRANLTRFLTDEGIPGIDCHHEIQDYERVPEDGHPGARVNRLWARCLHQELEGRL